MSRRDLTEGSLIGHLFRLSGPAILALILHNFYGVNDTFFAARLGAAESNAMGLILFVLILNFSISAIVSRGVAPLVSRFIGAKDRRSADHMIAQALVLSMTLATLVGIAGSLLSHQFVGWLGGDGETIAPGTSYLRTLYLFQWAMFLPPLVDSILIASGNTVTPMLLQGFSVSLNTLLNWLVVDGPGLFGLPALGLGGLAMTTAVSRGLAGSIGLYRIFRGATGSKPHFQGHWKPEPKAFWRIARLGLPTAASIAMYSGVYVVLTNLISEFGQDALGALGIGFRGIESFSFHVMVGFGMATATLVGQNLGAKKPERSARSAWIALGVAIVPATMFTLAFLIFPRELVALYTDEPGITHFTVGYVSTIAWSQFTLAFEEIFGEALIGAGCPRWFMFVVVPANILRIPIAWLLAFHTSLGILGVWWAINITTWLKAAILTGLFWKGPWRDKEI
ncbi:MAG: MATE family efflux transporter [Planctomycetota bacterium]